MGREERDTKLFLLAAIEIGGLKPGGLWLPCHRQRRVYSDFELGGGSIVRREKVAKKNYCCESL